MRHIIWKTFFIWDFDKEEKWLNEMSARGLQLVKVSFMRYTFEDGTPGEYQYCLEFLNKWPSEAESVEYIRFLEESGAEHVGSILRWVYIRRKASDSGFELFNDLDSRIRHLKRIIWLPIIFLPMLIFFLIQDFIDIITTRSMETVIVFCLQFTILLLITYGIVKITLKINKLRKDRFIRE